MGPSFSDYCCCRRFQGIFHISDLKAAQMVNFEQAEADMKEASSLLLEAHEFQTEMITQEASGNIVPVNIILVSFSGSSQYGYDGTGSFRTFGRGL